MNLILLLKKKKVITQRNFRIHTKAGPSKGGIEDQGLYRIKAQERQGLGGGGREYKQEKIRGIKFLDVETHPKKETRKSG